MKTRGIDENVELFALRMRHISDSLEAIYSNVSNLRNALSTPEMEAALHTLLKFQGIGTSQFGNLSAGTVVDLAATMMKLNGWYTSRTK